MLYVCPHCKKEFGVCNSQQNLAKEIEKMDAFLFASRKTADRVLQNVAKKQKSS